MTYDFRKAELKDEQSVFLLFRKVTEHMCARNIDQWDERYPDIMMLQSDIRNQQMYVLCKDDSIVAAVVINDMHEEEYENGNWRDNGKYAVIHRLCVDPEHQNSGLGKKILYEAEKLIKETGCASIRLDAFSQNPYALKMYTSFGYSIVGEVEFFKGVFYLFEKLI